MGALHEGHLTLLQSAKSRTDLTVVSIFVNPTQFNDPADFKKYPITIEKDIQLLLANDADILFLPTMDQIYPSGLNHPKQFALGDLENILEGKFRPGHFQGVSQVMDRLLGIVAPDQLFMGRKDYQQCMVVEKLISLENFKTTLSIVDTVRENDGLAMSSRNMRLNSDERAIAPSIYRSLEMISKNIEPGNQQTLLQQAKDLLAAPVFRLDYLELADAKTLQPVAFWDGKQKLVLLVAAFLNDVRLIDNLPV